MAHHVLHQHDPPWRIHIRYTGGHVEDFETVKRAFQEWYPESFLFCDESTLDEITLCFSIIGEQMLQLLQLEFEDLKVGGEITIGRVQCQGHN